MDRDKAGTVNLPDRVADLISSKIDNLSPGTKELLEIAACAGSSFTPAMLNLITGYPTDYLEEQLGTLCRLGLIVETGAYAAVLDKEGEIYIAFTGPGGVSRNCFGAPGNLINTGSIFTCPFGALGGGYGEMLEYIRNFLDKQEM